MKKLYILHEYGSPSHYYGLVELCNQNDVLPIYREFDILHLMLVACKHADARKFFKQFLNFCFLICLPFTKNKVILLGACPYDWKLYILGFLLKRHKIYYHTSYTMWDPVLYDFHKKVSQRRINFWKNFLLNRVEAIFSVTNKTKSAITNYIGYNPDNIHVVNHAYIYDLKESDTYDNNTFIFVGRMTDAKGIKEICEYFTNHPDLKLILIGRGSLNSYVRKMAQEYPNIEYEGYIKGLDKIIPYYHRCAYFILNSKSINKWEELFGLSLIEAMSCGLIPISVRHSGPMEIITNDYDGILFNEGELSKTLDFIRSLTEEQKRMLRANAVSSGRSYRADSICYKWRPILKSFSND